MRGMIVAAQPEAAEVGALVLRRGGNAIDAAIACAFTQCVVDPQMAGIAGYGAMQVFMPGKGVHETIEFYGRSPLATREDMWADILVAEPRDGFGFILKDHVSEIGYQSVGTPMKLKGLCHALECHGTISLAEAIAPAIGFAERGFMVRPSVEQFWKVAPFGPLGVSIQDALSLSEAGRRSYFRSDGQLKKSGDIVSNPELANTLRRIAVHGPDIFYKGEIAEEIAADFAKNGGLLSLADLTAVEVDVTPPVWGSYRKVRVASTAPPGGGVSLIQALQVLDRFELRGMEHNDASHLRLLAEILKRITADKYAHIGDPRFVENPTEWLMSQRRADEHAEDIRSGRVASLVRMTKPPEQQNTTHVTVVDKEGNIVSLTHTLNMPSGVVTPALGVMYTGLMSAFDPRPGSPASLAPGKGRTSSQMPTIVFDDDRPVLAIGAPGGTNITSAMTQCVSNIVDFGMNVLEAVVAPRISVTSDVIDISNRIPRHVQSELEDAGYTVMRTPIGYAFAALHAIHLGPELSGAADPQRDGMWMRG